MLLGALLFEVCCNRGVTSVLAGVARSATRPRLRLTWADATAASVMAWSGKIDPHSGSAPASRHASSSLARAASQPRSWASASSAFALGVEQRLEGAPVCIAREHLVAVDQVAQRHGFAPQGINDVPVIDDMAAAAVSRPSPARQGHQRRRGEEQFQAVVVDARGQWVADQAGGHGVEHAPVGEPRGRCDAHTDRVEVVGASRRQRSEYRALDVDARTQMAVAATDDLIDEGAVVGERALSD